MLARLFFLIERETRGKSKTKKQKIPKRGKEKVK
jgi:hypothetical protein